MSILNPAEINDQGRINPIDPGIRVRGYGARAPGVESRHVTGAFRVRGAAADTNIALPDYSDKVWDVEVVDGGSYTGTVDIEFAQPPGAGVRATGTVRLSGGTDKSITGITITNRGSGYNQGPPEATLTITSGLGTRSAVLKVFLGANVIAAGIPVHDIADLVTIHDADTRVLRFSKDTSNSNLVVVYANPT